MMSLVTVSAVPDQATMAALTLSNLVVADTLALKLNVTVLPIKPMQSLFSIIVAIPNFLFVVSTSKPIAN